MDHSATLAWEFERESHRIDQLIWDAIALRAGESALFCGYSNNADWIKRAVAIGVDVSVIANDADGLRDLDGLPIKVLRGSTSLLPARDASFDVTIAFHYLHEVDPFFHANVVSELGRVGKRCIIVEPAPPSDLLGLRIAALYSRAKRELGQFEHYHHIDYWRKLLSIVKSDVTFQEFSFTRRPPRAAIRDTVALIIDTMAAEETPEPYLAELRALAKRPEAQLVPQSRYVVVGTAAGVLLNAGAGTDYRDRPEPARPPAPASRYVPLTLAQPANRAVAATPASQPRIYSRPDIAAEFPTVEPPPAARPVANPSQIARNAFGLPTSEPAARPGSVPTVKADETEHAFGPPEETADSAAEFGWEWETPG